MAGVLLQFSLLQLGLVAGAAVFASVVGGIAGYGTGLLLPVVLVPIIGPEPVVPVMAIASLLINVSRVAAFRAAIEWRRTLVVLATAVPACVLGAWFYTRLSTAGTQLVIGAFLVASVPLRRFSRRAICGLEKAGLPRAAPASARSRGRRPGRA